MRSRRALSTVVGAVFAIIALTSTVTYVSYSMGILDNYNQSVLTKNQQLSDVNKEKFQISSVTVPNGKLNITVANTGSLPINFTKIWIQNQTAYSSGIDWVNSYTPTNNFVAPGGVLIKMGQKIPVTINSAYSYNVKLVTSRGNTQQFSINSANISPLNIQLLVLPPTVPSGFKTGLIMIVINNSTNTLTGISPNTPVKDPSSNAKTCSLSTVSPASYDTLAPGAVAIFKWDLTVSGDANQFCKYTASLQNGYIVPATGQVQTTQPATATTTAVFLSSTTFAQNAGLISIDYAAWNYSALGSGWQTNWQVPVNQKAVFAMKITNNNSTGTLWISKKTTMMMTAGTASPTYVYVINSTNEKANPPTITASCTSNDFCLSLGPEQSMTLYLGADGPASANVQTTPNQAKPATGFILLFGKFGTNTAPSGALYAQNIPYIAINLQ